LIEPLTYQWHTNYDNPKIGLWAIFLRIVSKCIADGQELPDLAAHRIAFFPLHPILLPLIVGPLFRRRSVVQQQRRLKFLQKPLGRRVGECGFD